MKINYQIKIISKNNSLKNKNRLNIQISDEDEKNKIIKLTEEDKIDQDKKKYKIYYKIIKNIYKSYRNLEKNSFDGSIDEIILRELIKIHNKDNDKNREKIDKAYNIFQNEKSQKINKLINNNVNKIYYNSDGNKNFKKVMKKSNSMGKLKSKNNE